MRWLLAGLCILVIFAAPSMVGLADPTATPTATPRPTQVSSGCSLPFNPCGALPFNVPRFATVALVSPSPIPTLPSPTPVPVTATPTYTSTPTSTLTPSYTPTGTLSTPGATIQAGGESIATLADSLGSMAGTLAAQATHQILIDGTPSSPEIIAGQLGNYAGQFFGIFRAFQQMDSFTFGIFSFLLLVLAFVLTVTMTTTIGGILLAMMRIILNIWSSIKPF